MGRVCCKWVIKAPVEVLSRLRCEAPERQEKGRTGKLVRLRQEPHAILEGLIHGSISFMPPEKLLGID